MNMKPMNTTKKILFADNDVDFVETRSQFLESAGYEVVPAYDPEQAKRIPIHQEDGSSDSSVFPWVSSAWVLSGCSKRRITRPQGARRLRRTLGVRRKETGDRERSELPFSATCKRGSRHETV